ncbi:MAG: Ig-like domain-containing protein [Pirellulales bacterium]
MQLEALEARQLLASNVAPQAVADSYAVFSDTTLNIPALTGVLANDTDDDGDSLTAVPSLAPFHGTLTLNADGSFTYVPNAGYVGSDQFEYRANDGTVDSSSAIVQLTVVLANVAPVAQNDSYTSYQDSQLIIAAANGVLANDTDANGDGLTAALVQSPSHGTLTLNADGSFNYQPAAGYVGADSFTYQVSDDTLTSNTATVNLTLLPLNNAPVANNDSYVTFVDTGLTVSSVAGVLANDIDADNDTLTAVLVSGPAHGTLTLQNNGAFTYQPAAGYQGSDSFTYQAADGIGTSPTATVALSVTTLNSAPLAAADDYSTAFNTPLVVPALAGVLANDSDVDLDPLIATLLVNPSFGTVTLQSSGAFTYTPGTGFSGTDTFAYQANDGQVDSNAAVVTIHVAAENFVPVATGDSYSTSLNTPLTVPTGSGVLANDTDANSDPLTAVLVSGPTHGTLTLNATGSFTYNPATGYTGSDSFTYRANDGTADSNTATVTLTVNALNAAPVAVADSYATTLNTPLTVAAGSGVLANDTDTNSDPLTAALVAGPAHGTLTLNTDGSFTYTPTTDYTGSDSFTYQANDGAIDSNIATVTLTINALNAAPVAVADSYATTLNTPLTVAAGTGVLANDTDTNSDPLTAALVAGPAHGTLTLNANGSFTYTPTTGYTGSDSFTYRANDGALNSNTATVTLTVNALNAAPVAVADSYAATLNTPLSVPAGSGVLANDTDANGNTLTASLISGPVHGTVTLNANGSFTYTPTTGYTGSDSFSYQANDGALNSNTVTVNLTVSSLNAAPVAVADSYAATLNTPLTVAAGSGVLANDTDANGDVLTAGLIAGPGHGTVTLNANGSFTYTPTTGYTGPDSFTYQASDGSTSSNTATVTLTVNALNAAPVAVADSYTAALNTALTIAAASGVLANDTDANSNTLTAALVSGPAHGTVTLNANGSFTYTPTTGYTGSDSFTYKANDGALDSNTATVSLNVVTTNSPPVANADSYAAFSNSVLTIAAANGVLANDTDANGTSLSAVLAVGPSHGTLTLNTNGSFTYTPVAGYVGSDSFTYVANDGLANSSVATVSLSVVLSNVAPVAVNDSYTVGSGILLTIGAGSGVLANDTDANGDVVAAQLMTSPAHGTLTLNDNGSFTYTSTAGYSGSDSFTYRASDGTLNSNTATVTLTITNAAPVANADTYTVFANGVLNRSAANGVLANDTDAEGNNLTASVVTQPTHGSVMFSSDGSFVYNPQAGYSGPDSFTYTANDGNSTSSPATVALTVIPLNSAPVANNDTYSVATGGVLTVTTALGVLNNDTDVDANTLTATLVNAPTHGTLTLNSNGSFTYTPTAGYSGADSFTYTAGDGTATSNVATVGLTVTATNAAPVANPDTYSTTTGQALTVTNTTGVLANDTDANGNPLTAVLVTSPTNGTVSLSANGSFTYTPNSGFTGTDSFSYKANDGQADSPTTTASVSVTAAAAVNNNGATSVTLTGPTSGYRGQVLTYRLAAVGSTATQVTFDIDWNNDGTTDQTVTGAPAGVDVTHAFATAGTTTAKVSLNGGNLSSTLAVTLSDVSKTGSSVTVGGTAGDDVITISPWKGTGVSVRLNGAVVAQYKNITQVVIHGGDGNDTITADKFLWVPVVLHGGAGNDRLTGGFRNDLLDGGDGDDVLSGGFGNDILVGGAGNDQAAGGWGDDVIVGGAGQDNLRGDYGTNLILGGSTTHDTNDAALLSLVNAWSRPGSLNRRLERVNASVASLSGAAVTPSDGAVDTIVSRGAMDWIWASLADADNVSVKSRLSRVVR